MKTSSRRVCQISMNRGISTCQRLLDWEKEFELHPRGRISLTVSEVSVGVCLGGSLRYPASLFTVQREQNTVLASSVSTSPASIRKSSPRSSTPPITSKFAPAFTVLHGCTKL